MRNMKSLFRNFRITFLTGCLILSVQGYSQVPGPITTAGTASVCAGTTFSIPVTVVDFFNVGIISLKINYDAAKVQYQSVTVNPDLNSLNPLYSGSSTQFTLSAFGSTGVNLDDNTVLFTMTFLAKTGVSGTTAFTWNSSPGSCEYAPPAPDPPYLTLPFGNFFINGSCTIHATPVPVISGPNNVCQNSSGNIYTTETSMVNYLWTVSPGGTIQSGGGTSDPSVTVLWNTPGTQSVSVAYTTNQGCASASPTSYSVLVNPFPDAPGQITGSTSVCGGTSGVVYSVTPVANATSYIWTVPVGASIVSGGNTNSITVNYAPNASSGFISVYGVNSCGNGSTSPMLPVTVTLLPGNAGIISGNDSVCSGQTNADYTVLPIANATGYTWIVPYGAVITAGNNTNSITVYFSSLAVSGVITVQGYNSCGSGTISADFPVMVSPVPDPPVISLISPNTLWSSVPQGNQWYRDGTLLPGQTNQTCIPTVEGDYWDVITMNGCSSDTSNHLAWPDVGVNDLKGNCFSVSPIPNDGHFLLSMEPPVTCDYSMEIFNSLGICIVKKERFLSQENSQAEIDLRPVSEGIYLVVLSGENERRIRTIIIRK